MATELLRERHIKIASTAFIALAIEIDRLLDTCAIYFNDKPISRPTDRTKREDLRTAVLNIMSITRALADVIKRWKQGIPQIVSCEGIEIYLLNELWANIYAVLYFLRSEGISTKMFDDEGALEAFSALVTSNRSLAH
jgi:hypothetical protein